MAIWCQVAEHIHCQRRHGGQRLDMPEVAVPMRGQPRLANGSADIGAVHPDVAERPNQEPADDRVLLVRRSPKFALYDTSPCPAVLQRRTAAQARQAHELPLRSVTATAARLGAEVSVA
jgi:hypothetical protein